MWRDLGFSFDALLESFATFAWPSPTTRCGQPNEREETRDKRRKAKRERTQWFDLSQLGFVHGFLSTSCYSKRKVRWDLLSSFSSQVVSIASVKGNRLTSERKDRTCEQDAAIQALTSLSKSLSEHLALVCSASVKGTFVLTLQMVMVRDEQQTKIRTQRKEGMDCRCLH